VDLSHWVLAFLAGELKVFAVRQLLAVRWKMEGQFLMGQSKVTLDIAAGCMGVVDNV